MRLDSALGRALISLLLVFAQMEREAVGERTREAIEHICRSGDHVGTLPYGKRVVRAPDNPRMKVLLDDESKLAAPVPSPDYRAGSRRPCCESAAVRERGFLRRARRVGMMQ